MELGFKVVGRLIAERGMSALGIVVGDVVADFEPDFGQAGEVAAVEQLRFRAAPKGLGVGRTRRALSWQLPRLLMLCRAP